MTTEADFARFRADFTLLRDEVGRGFVGQSALVENVLICLMCRGHVLLEGMPGLGKTLLVKTLSRALDLRFSRIQCTPDLMPADIIGTNVLVEGRDVGRQLQFQRGPLFSNIVLADEVNRATPKTQSAFLEAMEERCVTAFGVQYPLDSPFFLLATQNSIELEGTYPLPEAQLDRFFFGLQIAMPSVRALEEIMDLTTDSDRPEVRQVLDRTTVNRMIELARQVKIATSVKQYAIRLMRATHSDASEASAIVREYVKFGASLRASQCMIMAGKVRAILDGRFNVSIEDIRQAAIPAMEHRIVLNFHGQVQNLSRSDLIREILRSTHPGEDS